MTGDTAPDPVRETEHAALVELAAAWRPQRPGKRATRDIVDALVEPEWGGLRVVAALTEDRAIIAWEGAEVSVAAELAAALVTAFLAADALVEGHLTTSALQSGEGALPSLAEIERPPILVPRGIGKKVTEDPYIQARNRESQATAETAKVLQALEHGERHAFVATDLLWLDGEPLDDVPLLERKRLLDGVLEPSYLVRVAPRVKPSAILTLVAWGTLGFGELNYRAANSRYLAGEENADWAVGKAPVGPQGRPKQPTKGPVPRG
jgi:hypothetical protein